MLGEGYKLGSSSLCSLLQPPLTSYLFRPKILFRTLFSNTHSPCLVLEKTVLSRILDPKSDQAIGGWVKFHGEKFHILKK
jgi:hypothetical protein